MYPGQVTRLSERRLDAADVIVANADLLILDGATTINTIQPSGLIGAQLLFLLPVDGSVALGTSGNIAVAQTMIINKITCLIYSQSLGEWFPHALA